MYFNKNIIKSGYLKTKLKLNLQEVETVEETAEEQVQVVPHTESESIHSFTEVSGH